MKSGSLFKKLALAALLATSMVLTDGVQSKQHIKVKHVDEPDDHENVKAVTYKEDCIFEIENENGDLDRYCLNYQGSQTLGFEWDQDNLELDKSQQIG